MRMVFLDTFTKLRKVTISFVMSVYLSVSPSILPHTTAGFLLVGFSFNLTCAYFLNICQENSSFIKI